MSYPIPENEQSRLKALSRLHILDTEEEDFFDNLSKIAAFIMETPVAFITLIDKDRQYFKSKFGMTRDGNRPGDIPREFAFCSYTIMNPDGSLTIPDTHLNADFANNPQVAMEDGIRFYFGVPITTKNNEAVGSVCVVDRIPRDNPTDEQKMTMKALAETVMYQFEMRERFIEIDDEVFILRAREKEVSQIGMSFQQLNAKCDVVLDKIKLRNRRREAEKALTSE